MDHDMIYITSDSYHDALNQWIGGPGAFQLQQELIEFDNIMGVVHLAVSSANSSKEPVYMFRVLDPKKFQQAVLKYGLEYNTPSSEH